MKPAATFALSLGLTRARFLMTCPPDATFRSRDAESSRSTKDTWKCLYRERIDHSTDTKATTTMPTKTTNNRIWSIPQFQQRWPVRNVSGTKRKKKPRSEQNQQKPTMKPKS